MELIEKPLKDCSLRFLDKAFNLEEVDTLQSLEEWMSMSADITDMERSYLLYLQKVLDFNVHDWNEYELDSHFIGPVFTLVNFSSKKFNHYSQRLIRGVIGEYELFGKPDGMVASGRREPEKPYFAFQEYKKELDPNGDPAGQALAAMLLGQALNEDKQMPMYGCYVSGQNWHFMTCEGNQYCITPTFSALTNDIFEIFRLLKALKCIIEQHV
jgi:hypothetical protein